MPNTAKKPSKPKSAASSNPEYRAIAEQWAEARRAKEEQEAQKAQTPPKSDEEIKAEREGELARRQQREAAVQLRRRAYLGRWWWTVGFWAWLLAVHVVGILFFTSGFLLTRLVLDERSSCAVPPPTEMAGLGRGEWEGEAGKAGKAGKASIDRSVDAGCWHPKSFDRAVVILVDALRYDFTVPRPDNVDPQAYHDAFPFLYDSAVQSPQNAFLRPFIADPPTTTLQRLKGLTTGTLPTFVDMGSNFAGTAIEEDNLLMQLRESGKRIAHLGDDTWLSLFPGYFEANISHAYDSFNVWDLHTVDNGVATHLAPLLRPERAGEWDLLIGHCLGVDHAGHRYGPDHPAMAAKLRQTDSLVREVTALIDDRTLLVVMGDHGMDTKGDHGGESDDEVEAALWMYSKRPIFGRIRPEFATPPATAKMRPVGQIDLVPTLALLLGIPIPYNNLGRPIEEAFVGPAGNDWQNLAVTSHLAAAGVRRYQQSYFAAHGVAAPSDSQSARERELSPTALWEEADDLFREAGSEREAYDALTRFQEETLRICKRLWAQFDTAKMATGIVVMVAGVVALVLYSARSDTGGGDGRPVAEIEPDLTLNAESGPGSLQVVTKSGNDQLLQQQQHLSLHRHLVTAAAAGAGAGAVAGLALVAALGVEPPYIAATVALFSTLSVVGAILSRDRPMHLLPTTAWGWLAVIFTVGPSVGFASNSYTVWEDKGLMFVLSTFGAANLVRALHHASARDRILAAYHSVAFMGLGRVASLSRLCREEQIPFCKSTYYASATSSTSAPWQLAIPVVVTMALPAVVRSFMASTRSLEGLAPAWIGYGLRTGLAGAAAFWALDAADNDGWLDGWLDSETLKAGRVYLAQALLAAAFVGGTAAFARVRPCVAVAASRGTVEIVGFGNVHGSRYLFLPLNMVVGLILLSKPMGGGALGLMVWHVLTLAELVEVNGLKEHPVGAVVLAATANLYFFATGHQAVLSTIQWDAAFVPLFTLRYPWAPIAVALNTFAGQALAVVAAPLLLLWRTGPRRRAVLETAARRVLAPLVAYFAVEAVATMVCAAWLRRHLMLYRVFGPRFMMAAIVLLVVDVVVLLCSLGGLRANTLAVADVFGWVE